MQLSYDDVSRKARPKGGGSLTLRISPKSPFPAANSASAVRPPDRKRWEVWVYHKSLQSNPATSGFYGLGVSCDADKAHRLYRSDLCSAGYTHCPVGANAVTVQFEQRMACQSGDRSLAKAWLTNWSGRCLAFKGWKGDVKASPILLETRQQICPRKEGW